jgi:hypothetical protein
MMSSMNDYTRSLSDLFLSYLVALLSTTSYVPCLPPRPDMTDPATGRRTPPFAPSAVARRMYTAGDTLASIKASQALGPETMEKAA